MRRERDAAAITLQVIRSDDALLIKIAGGDAIGDISHGAGDVEIVVGGNGGLKDLFLPISIGGAQKIFEGGTVVEPCAERIYKMAELGGGHHIFLFDEFTRGD